MTRNEAVAIGACVLVVLLAGCIEGDDPRPALSDRQAIELAMSFHVPAQLQGHAGYNGGQWVLLVFSPASQGQFSLASPGGEATNHADAKVQVREPRVHSDWLQPVSSSDEALPNPFHADAVLGANRWSSLYVEASSILIDLQQVDGTLDRADATRAMSALPDRPVPFATYRWPTPAIPGDAVILAFEGEDADAPFTMSATGVSRVLWYNATVTCSSDGYCPDGPAYQSTPMGSNSHVDMRTYTELRLDGAELMGGGSAYIGVMGGGIVDLEVEGAIRLPDAVGTCSTSDCVDPDRQTFTASGLLGLKGLTPVDGTQDRVETRMVGELHSVSLDEVKVFGLSPADAALAGAAIAAVLVVAVKLVKLAFALFTRHQRAALDNHRTREIHDVIVGKPGLSFKALLRATGSGSGNLQGHLMKLVSERHVVARRYRNTVRYYENHGRYDDGWQRHAVLHDETNRRLHDWIIARPGSTQTQVLAAAKSWGVARSTAQNSLKTLKGAGLLLAERDGHFVHYRAVAQSGT